MSLTPAESSAVETCIDNLLRAHVDMPFGILRERGVVSELRNRLLQGPFPDAVSPKEIVQYPGRPEREAPCAYVRGGVNTGVYRVQQEIETALEESARSGPDQTVGPRGVVRVAEVALCA